MKLCAKRLGHRLLTGTVLLALHGLHVTVAEAQTIQVGNLRVELERIVNRPPPSTLSLAVTMDTPMDDTDRLFFADVAGSVKILENGSFTTFLDISEETYATGETGLLGFTFHPGFADPESAGYGKLYTQHSVQVDPEATIDFASPGVIHHHNVLTEWQVDPNDPNQVDMASRREVLREEHPDNIHAGGNLEFGPDGYLYGGFGTPARSGSNHARGQDPSNIHGTLYRIDPLAPEDTPLNTDPIGANGKYRIAAGNPFVNDPAGLDEVFAYGVREPYRFSHDPETGLLFLGDVGQGAREELDVVPIGGNMGWPYREGSGPGIQAPPNPPPDMIDPIADYTHADGIAIIGGYVYRGSIPELQGKYIFGELAFGPPPRFQNQGRLLWIDPYDEVGELKDASDIRIQELAVGPTTCADSYNDPGDCTVDMSVISFGIDDEGELYALGIRAGRVIVYKFASAYFLPDGDYNQDGIVDAADYTVWRDTLGSTGDLRANGDNTGDSAGVVDQADYDVWAAHFGESIAEAGSASGGAAAVPEPLAGVMFGLGVFYVALFGRVSRCRKVWSPFRSNG